MKPINLFHHFWPGLYNTTMHKRHSWSSAQKKIVASPRRQFVRFSGHHNSTPWALDYPLFWFCCFLGETFKGEYLELVLLYQTWSQWWYLAQNRSTWDVVTHDSGGEEPKPLGKGSLFTLNRLLWRGCHHGITTLGRTLCGISLLLFRHWCLLLT